MKTVGSVNCVFVVLDFHVLLKRYANSNCIAFVLTCRKWQTLILSSSMSWCIFILRIWGERSCCKGTCFDLCAIVIDTSHSSSNNIWRIVKMATGAGWQQYYSPAAGNPSSGAGKYNSGSSSTITMEYTQDLHLKMSKKIAQLTKVRIVTVIVRYSGIKGPCIRCCDPATPPVKARVLRR